MSFFSLFFGLNFILKQLYRTWLPYTRPPTQTNTVSSTNAHKQLRTARNIPNDWLSVYCYAFWIYIYMFWERRWRDGDDEHTNRERKREKRVLCVCVFFLHFFYRSKFKLIWILFSTHYYCYYTVVIGGRQNVRQTFKQREKKIISYRVVNKQNWIFFCWKTNKIIGSERKTVNECVQRAICFVLKYTNVSRFVTTDDGNQTIGIP